MKKYWFAAIFVAVVVAPAFASRGKQIDRLDESATVFREVMDIPEDSIPEDLFKKAECIVIIPSMKKGALGVGGAYGKGEILCRVADGWSPPVMVLMTGGSFGFQLGGSSTDVILLVMNKRGVNKLLESKVTLGADASAAAGPKGRSTKAATDIQMRAEILSWARSRGLFAGVSLEGCVLKPDSDDNIDLYGEKVDARQLLLQGGAVPSDAENLVSTLKKYDVKIAQKKQIDPVDSKSDQNK